MTEFEQIYRRYFNDVFLYLKKISKDEKLAEELTSDTFFKALNALESFNGSCDLRVWLCQIAKNSYISHLRKCKPLVGFEEVEDFSHLSEINVDELIDNSTLTAEIHRALHELKEPYKEVFSLRIFAELSFKQIGDIFSKTDNWACVTFHRAIAKIKNRLENVQ